MGLVSSGKTDIGQKRKTNQDSIYLNKERNFFIVADGMGGHNGGDIASGMAVEFIPDYLIKNIEKGPVELSKESVNFANNSIKERGEKDPNLVGMGTTVVQMLFRGANLYLANVGDSRGYMVNNNRLFQLSKDHSLVQEKLNLGIYDRLQAKQDPQKNVLVRTVGFESDIEVDVFTYKVSRNDIFLTCSDGLHGKVSDPDILFILNKHIPEPSAATQQQVDQAVDALIKQANDNGGNDNISVIIVVAR
ncbi:MAG: Stp1/IreP family PP2C-type Ser/Thr phosphatase [Halobacteriovoraceae bacterium]|jgi:PPM family protein phosphatase|nr:Stp1/IreP family PP2C-type Ser/Thr phosphatase [Halobacteriovoraceae bacterium]MBT5094136.1 Stp1/IreP family PP2C-type Ser/Thr phosphatase [Halobacteriovoraceae bacterium]